MLRGHTFEEQVFGVDIYALFNNTFTGGECGVIKDYKNEMEITTNGTNKLIVDSGACCIKGRFCQETDQSEITFSSNTLVYCSLVLEIDLSKTNTEQTFLQGQYKVVSDSSDYPILTQQDIINTNGVYQFELARFTCNSAGIDNLVDRRVYITFSAINASIGDLNNLTTTDKDNLVEAINEVNAKRDIIPNETSPQTEIKTDKVWIDGKPIYRQTLVYNARGADSQIQYALSNITNMDELVSLEGHMKSSSFKNVPLNYYYKSGSTIYSNSLYSTSSYIVCHTSVGWDKAYIHIEYTKTTDLAQI